MSQRATGEKEKQARRFEILEAAESLLKNESLDGFTMSQLAGVLGLAKGTLYLSFPSKEALVLALVSDKLIEAFDGLFQSESGDVPENLSRALAQDPLLVKLLAGLQPLLESKLAYVQAVEFKRTVAQILSKAAEQLKARVPGLDESSAFRFLLLIYALIPGLAQASTASPFMKRASQEPGLEAFALDFETTLDQAARALLGALVKP